jgi:hypothetical protein
MNAWDQLGIEPTQDIRLIKRAYSARLKTTRPDDDAQAYQDLREAYEWAQNFAKFSSSYDLLKVEQRDRAIDVSEVLPTIEEHPETKCGATPEQETEETEDEVRSHVLPAPEPINSGSESEQLDTVNVPIAQTITAENLVRDFARLWAESGTVDMVRAWPGQQSLLEELPFAEHHHASRLFAQFVVEESGLPVEILIALTRHFQWGLDFKVDQMLGPQLAQELYYQLSVADVFAAFHPGNYKQYAWALALAKLWDAKRWPVAYLLATALNCETRHQILNAKPSTLHALGASRASAKTAQDIAAKGGELQGILFALLIVFALFFLIDPVATEKASTNLAAIALTGAIALGLQFYIFREFNNALPLWRWIRRGKHLDSIALIPLLAAILVYLDQEYTFTGGFSSTSAFLGGLICLYLGLWLASPTDDHPWRDLVLPTFFLLLFGLQGLFAKMNGPLLISLAFAWTMGAHVVLRRYPEQTEAVYEKTIKLGMFKRSWWLILAIKFIGIFWIAAAVAMLPVLMFRMGVKYRPLYTGVAIYAGVLLTTARSAEGKLGGLLYGVLAALLCIQVLQYLSQRLADSNLKKLNL